MATVQTEIHVWFDDDGDYVCAQDAELVAERFKDELGTNLAHKLVLKLEVEIPPPVVFAACVPAHSTKLNGD